MKKKIIGIIGILVLLSSLMGCSSKLKRKILDEEARKNAQELSLTQVFDEENGYHYPSIHWGDSYGQILESTHDGLGEPTEYRTNVTIYGDAELYTKLNGRRNDEAAVYFTNGDCYLVTLVFDSDSDEAEIVSQSQVAAYYDELEKTFGKPTDVEETSNDIDGASMQYTTYSWNYTTPDDKETKLQFAVAYTEKGKEPSYISLNFGWVHEEEAEQVE